MEISIVEGNVKHKKVFIILCLAWTITLLCVTFLFNGKKYPVADEISVEKQPGPNVIVEFSYHYICKVYKEKGKYYISYENLRSEENDPDVFEITKNEYNYCAAIDPNRFKNYKNGGFNQYDINTRYGNDVSQYSVEGGFSPLFELEWLYKEKAGLNKQETYQARIETKLAEFLDNSAIEAAYITYPSESYSGNDFFIKGNALCADFADAYYNLINRHYCNQYLNIQLMKLYDAGTISKPNLAADYEKKKEIYEQTTGKKLPQKVAYSDSFYLAFLLRQDDTRIKQTSKRYILKKEVDALFGYTHKAYSNISYGDNGIIYYELYLPDEKRSCSVGIIKPALMPEWYLKMALNHILINDGKTISWGALYIFLRFFVPTVTGCLVLWFAFFGIGAIKRKLRNKQEMI